MLLEGCGYNVTLAEDGEDGLTVASSKKFDLIISDLMMPKMDGIQMLRAIRERGNRTPAILCTASKVESCPDADSLIAKPFDIDLMLDTVAALTTPVEAFSAG